MQLELITIGSMPAKNIEMHCVFKTTTNLHEREYTNINYNKNNLILICADGNNCVISKQPIKFSKKNIKIIVFRRCNVSNKKGKM